MTAQDAGYAHPEYLAETEWVVERLLDDNVVIVDTDIVEAYRRAHIPGAVLIPDNYEKDPDTKRVHILPADKFARVMESLGIGDDTLVVAYDNSRSLYAGRLWWALNYYGHTNVKVLNGGWKKWFGEGKSVTGARPEARKGGGFTAKADSSLIVTTEDLKAVYDRPESVVWDVRTREEYTGENTRGNRRSGHIPSARHLEWLEMVDEHTHAFKPAAEMRRILESKGITPDKEVFAH